MMARAGHRALTSVLISHQLTTGIRTAAELKTPAQIANVKRAQ